VSVLGQPGISGALLRIHLFHDLLYVLHFATFRSLLCTKMDVIDRLKSQERVCVCVQKTCACVYVLFRTVFLDHDWFTLETASTLVASHSGLLHVPVQTPAAAIEPTESMDQQQEQLQQKGKQKGQQKGKQRNQSPPPPPTVPLSPLEAAAAALSGTHFICHHCTVLTEVFINQLSGPGRTVDPLCVCLIV